MISEITLGTKFNKILSCGIFKDSLKKENGAFINFGFIPQKFNLNFTISNHRQVVEIQLLKNKYLNEYLLTLAYDLKKFESEKKASISNRAIIFNSFHLITSIEFSSDSFTNYLGFAFNGMEVHIPINFKHVDNNTFSKFFLSLGSFVSISIINFYFKSIS